VALSAFLIFLADRFSFTVRPGFLAADLRGDLSDTVAPHSDRRARPGGGSPRPAVQHPHDSTIEGANDRSSWAVMIADPVYARLRPKLDQQYGQSSYGSIQREQLLVVHPEGRSAPPPRRPQWTAKNRPESVVTNAMSAASRSVAIRTIVTRCASLVASHLHHAHR
jgi:hypothetical protein